MGRGKQRGGAASRDAGGFVALPWTVLDSAAYQRLSHPARTLLLEIARQYVRDNNGRLLCSMDYLRLRGWKSADVVQRAKDNLIEAGFIFETVKGARPNRASWYAVTWATLDRLDGFDHGAAESFRRSAYRDSEPMPVKPARQELYDRWKKNASLIPSPGIDQPLIVPSPGIGSTPVVPSPGTIDAEVRPLSIPSHGNHLDKPSIGAVQSASVPAMQASGMTGADTGETVRRFRERSACARLFDALMASPRGVRELEALGVANPRQRVRELRGRGYSIGLQTLDGVSRYVLLSTAPMEEPEGATT